MVSQVGELMVNQDERTWQIIGIDAYARLQDKHILLLGLGGVGGYIAEALVRSGIKHLKIVDHDIVSLSNLNRQMIALHSTLGKKKAEILKARLLDIRPDCEITIYDCFYLPENVPSDLFDDVDYIIDAIDTITAKIDLAVKAQNLNIPIIACMGTGNKLHPELLEVADIYDTSVCPLCKVMRRELKKREVKKLKVVYSKELPIRTGTRTPGSVMFVPASAGLLIASQVIVDLMH